MNDPAAAFAKMVPGFDFLQGLVKNAGAALPAMGQWIAPTLDPAELDKRINDLRTVQFWLEQNARMLGATIQALEVQRMTLGTLQTMNVSMSDLTESLKIRMPEAQPAPPAQAPAPAPRHNPFFSSAPTPAPEPEPQPEPTAAPEPPVPVSPPGVIDPMQWWGALTQQFTELAAKALKDGGGDAARDLAGSMVKQGLEAAGKTLKQAAAKSDSAAAVKSAGPAAAKSKPGKAGKPAAKRAAAKPRPSSKG